SSSCPRSLRGQLIERQRGAQLVIGDVTPLAAPGQQLLDRAGNDLGEGTLCCVLVRHIPSAHHRIIHEVPPLLPPDRSRPAVVGVVRQLRSKSQFRAARQGYMRCLSVWRAIFQPRTGSGLWPRNSIRDGEGSVNLASL